MISAAGLIGHIGSTLNYRNADAFASHAGTAPVQCSSGKYQSVRLNTGGNRQLNRCLHNIANSQMHATGHAGKVYYDRKRSEGKTHREAMRCLKRRLAAVVFRALKSASSPAAKSRPVQHKPSLDPTPLPKPVTPGKVGLRSRAHFDCAPVQAPARGASTDQAHVERVGNGKVARLRRARLGAQENLPRGTPAPGAIQRHAIDGRRCRADGRRHRAGVCAHGHEVLLNDVDEARIRRGIDGIAKRLQRDVTRAHDGRSARAHSRTHRSRGRTSTISTSRSRSKPRPKISTPRSTCSTGSTRTPRPTRSSPPTPVRCRSPRSARRRANPSA